MSRFTLATRVALLVGGALLTGVCSTGLVLWQLHATNASYDAMLSQDEVRHQDRAREIQVTFKIQVQEWKNLLLRGAQAEPLARYKRAFATEEASVRTQATALRADVSDPEARTLLDAFVGAHRAMGDSYARAIAAFEASGGRGVAAADALVKGQDRAPTESLDALAARLQQVVDEMRMAKSASVRRLIATLAVGLAVLFVSIVATTLLIVRTTQRQLAGLTGDLRDGSEQVATAAEGVAASAEVLSQGATEQAASLEEAAASMEELASMTRLHRVRAGGDRDAVDGGHRRGVGGVGRGAERARRARFGRRGPVRPDHRRALEGVGGGAAPAGRARAGPRRARTRTGRR